jgi:hypothetical protein
VGIRRSLVEANPAAHLPELARSLNNLSLGLGDADRSAGRRSGTGGGDGS